MTCSTKTTMEKMEMDTTAPVVTRHGSDDVSLVPVQDNSMPKSDLLTTANAATQTFPETGFTLVGVFDGNNQAGISSQQDREHLSREANIRAVKEILFSREDREHQRWAVEKSNDGQRRVRLVAGCIPILPGGKICLITGRRTPAANQTTDKVQNDGLPVKLGLPKGGWELDECIEECAIRETFEEAGVVGPLDPPLKSFCILSGKHKDSLTSKIRNDDESLPAFSQAKSLSALSSDITTEDSTTSDTDNNNVEKMSGSRLNIKVNNNQARRGRSPQKVHPSFCNLEEDFVQISDSSTSCPFVVGVSHTHTCLTFFPLYVQQISEKWPEQMRQRYVMSIHGTYQRIDLTFEMV
mmetsp:Transcript_44336/g.107159  ORF Transcript_44336/g.107159 Transcript_44336/m.107159 type:complete len:353 (-) Transcript_44336:255-1313(-)